MKQFYRIEDAVQALDIMHAVETTQVQVIAAVKGNRLTKAHELTTLQTELIDELIRLQRINDEHKKLQSIAKQMNAMGIDMEVIMREKHTQPVL